MLRRTFYILAGAVVLILGAGILLPFLISGETLRRQLITQVENQTGMVLRLDGDVSVSIFPRVAVSAEAVALAPAAGEEEIFAAREVRFALRIPPLFGGRAELTGLTLIKPEFTIAPGSTDAGAETSEAGAGMPIDSAQLERLRISRLGIEGGRVTVLAASGEPFVVDAINIRSRFDGVDSPARIDGGFTLMNVDHEVTLTIASLANFLDTGGADAEIAIETESAKIAADGRLWHIEGGSFDGQITAEIDEIDSMLAAYGQPPIGLAPLKLVRLRSGIVAASSGFRLSDLSAEAAGMKIAGDLSVILEQATPEIAAIVTVDKIDLAGFSGATVDKPKQGPSGHTDAGIDLTPLSLVEADAQIDIGQIAKGDTALKDISARFGIHGGSLEISSFEAAGLGGSARGSMRMQPDGTAGARISGQIVLNGVDIAQAATLAAANIPVDGSVSADLQYSAAGRNGTDFRDSLALSGNVSLQNGLVSGLKLAQHFGGDASADRVEQVSVDASLAGLDSPVAISGTAEWRNLPLTIRAELDTPGLILAGEQFDAEVSVASSLATIGYSGAVSVAQPGARGTVSLDTPSLTKLAAWLGRPVAVESGLQQFAIRGKLAYGGNRFAFADANLVLDGSQGAGTIEADLSGAVPGISARLAMQRLDVTPYLGGSKDGSAGGSPQPSAGWSDQPIDFAALSALDATFDLSTEELVWGALRTGRAKLDVVLEKGALTADLSQFALYGGNGVGRLKLASAGETPSIAADFRFDGLSLLPFLDGVAGFRRIDGTGSLDLAVTATGRSQRGLARTLSGRGALDFRDGAIRGINIPKMVRSLSSGILTGWQQSEAESTDFSSLTATYKISEGVLTNEDLQLIGPLVRMTGRGTVTIPDQSLAFRLDPRVVASLEGQGSDTELTGLGVPIVVEGPWSRPRIYPDIQGILENPDAALQTLRQLGQTGSALEQIGDVLPTDAGGAAGALLDAVLGANRTDKAQSEAQQGAGLPTDPGGAAGALLNNLLGVERQDEQTAGDESGDQVAATAREVAPTTIPDATTPPAPLSPVPIPRPRPALGQGGVATAEPTVQRPVAEQPAADINQLINQATEGSAAAEPGRTGTPVSEPVDLLEPQAEPSDTESGQPPPPQGPEDLANDLLNRLLGQ